MGYKNWSSSDLKCGTKHRGYPGTGIMEGDCTHHPEDWNNKSIQGDFLGPPRSTDKTTLII